MRVETSFFASWIVGCVLACSSSCARAHAQYLQHVTYVGGTVLPGSGMQGKLSISATNSLVFEGPSTISVPYDHVISYESAAYKQVHVGLLTEGLWRLVAPWPEQKRLSLSFRDSDDHAQVVVLQMSKGDEALLVEVLKTRASHGFSRPFTIPSHPVATGR